LAAFDLTTEDVYEVLEDAGFEPLRNAVKELYEEWL